MTGENDDLTKDDREEDPKKKKARRDWLRVVEGGLLVAAVTGGFSLGANYLAEDVKRCELATQFFIEFDGFGRYADDAYHRLVSAYLDMVDRNCLGG